MVEFGAEKERAIQMAQDKGDFLPDGAPSSLYDTIVKDYTGRTREAQDRTLIITHLNADRRALNSLIHDERQRNGETGRESVTLPVLVSANIRDGELRKTAAWAAHKDAVALLDNVYHRVAEVDQKNQLITLRDAEGRERLLSPREASAEDVILYRREEITLSVGDLMRFSKSDAERGYVANSMWEVKSVSGDSVTLSDGPPRTLNPSRRRAAAS